MRFNLSRRTKVISGIVFGVLLIAFSTLYSLAKFGIIQTNIFADALPSVSFHLFNNDTTNAGQGYIIKLAKGSNVKQATTNSSSLAIFNDLEYGTYQLSVVSGKIYQPGTSACVDGFSLDVTHAGPYSLMLCGSGGSSGDDGTDEDDDTSVSKYRFIGNVKSGSNLLSGVKVNIVDRSSGSDSNVTPEFTSSSSASYDGKNYKSAIFSRTYSASNPALDNLYIKFSKDGYQSQELKILDSSVISATSIIGSGDDAVIKQTIKDVNLVQIVTYTQTQKLDIQGKIIKENGDLLSPIRIQVNCPQNPTSENTYCVKNVTNNIKEISTRDTTSKTNGLDQNFLITYDYNIAKSDSQISTLEFWLLNLTEYYYDANNNNIRDDDEIGPNQKITIKRSDARTPVNASSNSYTVLNLTLKHVDFGAGITGKVYDNRTKQPIKDAVIGIQRDNTEKNYLPLSFVKTNNNGEYSMKNVLPAGTSLYILRAFHQNYADDSNAKINIRLSNTGSYRSPQTDFYLNNCY